MSPTFTDDDVGKTVESAAGEKLGVVVAVDPETAYVEPDPGVTDATRAVLDWESDSEDAVVLSDDSVDRVSEDAVHLEGAFDEEAITSGTADGDETPDDRAEGSRRRGAGYTPGEPVASTVTETETSVDGSNRGVGAGDPDDSDPGVFGESEDVARESDLTDVTDEIDGTEERRSGERTKPADERGAVGETDEPVERDPMGEMEDTQGADAGDESGGAGRTDAGDALDETEGSETSDALDDTERTNTAEALDSVEAEASRELDVDPTELTDGEANVEVRPDEDVEQRAEDGVEPDDARERAGGAGGPTTEDGAAEGTEVNPDAESPADTSESEAEDDRSEAEERGREEE